MKIMGESVTEKERERITKIAEEFGADEVTVGFMEFYDGWRMVVRFFKAGKLLQWISWE